MKNEQEIKELMCDIGRRVYNRDMIAANEGFMTPEYIVKVNAKGNVLEANPGFRPSSEVKMHMRVYEKRPDVNAVVHAHPKFATSFAIAGMALTQPIMPEAVVGLGAVPLAKYGTPSTNEVPDSIEEFLPYYDQVLLANHGALTWGEDLLSAYHKMESVEFYAELLYRSKMLGGPKEFTPDQVAKLYDIRKKLGMTGKHPADFQ